MALIKCEECGSSISDKADSCPHCGLPCRRTGNLIVDEDSFFLALGKTVCRIMQLGEEGVLHDSPEWLEEEWFTSGTVDWKVALDEEGWETTDAEVRYEDDSPQEDERFRTGRLRICGAPI